MSQKRTDDECIALFTDLLANLSQFGQCTLHTTQYTSLGRVHSSDSASIPPPNLQRAIATGFERALRNPDKNSVARAFLFNLLSLTVIKENLIFKIYLDKRFIDVEDGNATFNQPTIRFVCRPTGATSFSMTLDQDYHHRPNLIRFSESANLDVAMAFTALLRGSKIKVIPYCDPESYYNLVLFFHNERGAYITRP